MGSWTRLGRCLSSLHLSSLLLVSKRCAAGGNLPGSSGLGSGSRVAQRNVVVQEWDLSRLLLGVFSVVAWGDWGMMQAQERFKTGISSLPSDEGSIQVELVEGSLEEGEIVSNSHTARWRIYTNMGRELFSQGRLDEAEKYFVRALEEAKEGFGEEDAHVASSYNNLAELYRLKRDYVKAEPLYVEAVQRLERATGPEAPSVGFALHNLGSFYFIQKRFEEARDCYRIKGRTLGMDHPEYASTMFHLGEVLRALGHLTDAEAYIRDSVRILEEGGGGQSKAVVLRMGRLAEILLQSGQLREAENFQRKLLHILEISEGPESLNVATAADNLALTLQAQDDLTEAEELLQRCLYIRQQALSITDVQVGSTLSKLASVNIQLGEKLCASSDEKDKVAGKAEFEKAEILLQRAVRIAEQIWEELNEATRTAKNVPRVVNGSKRVDNITPFMGQSMLALTRSLNALATLNIRKAELSGTQDERCQARTEGLKLLRENLSLLDQPDISAQLSGWPDVQVEQMLCLQRLAGLLSTNPKGSRSEDKEEVEELLRKAAMIKSRMASTKSKSQGIANVFHEE